MRDDRERLLDILTAIEKIEEKAGAGLDAFLTDDLLQVWVVHHLEIIGEAANHISVSYQAEHSEIPWRKLIGMRHILVHGYFEVDLDIVWGVVEKDLPGLHKEIQSLL